MSLVGSLEDLSLLDILQIVNVSRRTGVLRLVIPGTGTTHVYFSAGNVSDVCGAFPEEPFLGFFERQGLVEPQEVAAAKASCNGDPVAVLERLVESGALNPRLAEQSRRLEVARRLRHLTQQNHGDFAFSLTETGQDLEGGAPKPTFPLRQAISPQNLLTQALAEASFSEAVPAEPQKIPEVAFFPANKPAPSAADLFDSGTFPTIKAEQEKPALAQPVQGQAIQAERPKPAPAPAPQPKPAAKSRALPILISQDTVFKGLLQRRLLSHFSQVEAVSDVGQYLEACRTHSKQNKRLLGLIDLLMPTRDGLGYLGGLEVVEESATQFPQVKLILMSDIADESLTVAARDRGASIVPKPGLALTSVQMFEGAIDKFAEALCQEADRLVPPFEDEVAHLIEDLGGETGEQQPQRVSDQLGLLKGLMGELTGPKESSEISLLILRLAAEYFERAVLFVVKPETLSGFGGFGQTGDDEKMIEKVRRMDMSLDSDSLLHQSIQERNTILRTAETFTPSDEALCGMLGLYVPRECVAIPMISRGRVVTVLYGDNAFSGEPMKDMTGIEIFIAQAGLALERALLEMQLLSLKKGQQGSSR